MSELNYLSLAIVTKMSESLHEHFFQTYCIILPVFSLSELGMFVFLLSIL